MLRPGLVRYRWHSAISAKDEKWLEDYMFSIFQKPIDQVNPMEFGQKLKKVTEECFGDDRRTWTHGKLQRGEDGSFNDNDLVKILSEATDEVAGAFGARSESLSIGRDKKIRSLTWRCIRTQKRRP